MAEGEVANWLIDELAPETHLVVGEPEQHDWLAHLLAVSCTCTIRARFLAREPSGIVRLILPRCWPATMLSLRLVLANEGQKKATK